MEASEEERSDIEEETVGEQSEDVSGRTAAGHGMESRSRGVFEELWEEEEADELKEEEDIEEQDAGVKTEPETEVKTEHCEETEPYEESGYYETEELYETEPSREERSQYGPSAYPGYGGVYYAGPGYGQYGDYGGYSQPLDYEGYGEAYEEPRYHRGPSGVITSRTVPPRVSKKQVLVMSEPGSMPVKPSSKAPTVARPSGSPPAKAPASTKPVARAKPKGGAVGATGTPQRAPRTVQSPSAAPVSSIALTHAVSNAVKVLPLFHSAGVTVEKARDLWEAFEDTTRGLPDRSRLLVFRQKIKGSEAERWWNNSSIKTFETLKIRFHNHFLSRTADELWERFYSTKRARGGSIEEWGDRVSDLCDSLDYPDPRMRYQLFRRGLNNRRMQAILDSSPACAIPEACEWLMAKDMYRPAEEDEDFDDGTAVKNGSKSEKTSLLLPVLDQVNALAQEVRTSVKGEKEWRNKVNNQLQATRQNSYQEPSTVAAIPPPTQPAQGNKDSWCERTVVAGAETKKAVGPVAVQEEVVKNEVSDEPRTDESAVMEAEAVVPEEAVNKVVVGIEPVVAENDAVHEGKAGDSAEETPAQDGTDESSGVKIEKEEYDKESEDRLFPLDEVELLKRVKKNAEAQKEPSIEDIAKHLDLPVEVLEQTKEASPDEMSSPEYWLEWFQSTLESSEEAKRANRDCNAVGPGTMQGVPGATEVMYEDLGLSKRRNNADEDQQERISKASALVTETDVLASRLIRP
ncbi:unnamed protein product [Phytophthora fragariaefolia]|uniref:Unnamed protein product n=1 Tax=Phytophthora fragariaefolia TaxID=1490495 RepID=A0A9W7D3S1_9STRA|nr:unnamed protein product [Phytophthora fragariaefolia]